MDKRPLPLTHLMYPSCQRLFPYSTLSKYHQRSICPCNLGGLVHEVLHLDAVSCYHGIFVHFSFSLNLKIVDLVLELVHLPVQTVYLAEVLVDAQCSYFFSIYIYYFGVYQYVASGPCRLVYILHVFA